MSLTTQQLQAINAYIASVPAWAALANDSTNAAFIADQLNVPTADFVVWRSRVDQDEIMQNGMDWTRVDNLTIGKARIWEWMFNNAERVFNPSKANVRAGIDATWVGTAADLAVRASVYGHCKRFATLGEKVLATGTGSDASPATMGYEGASATPMCSRRGVCNG